MRVLFVNPTAGFLNRSPVAPLGIIALATYLRGHGHDARIYDRILKKTPVSAQLADYKPDLVAVSIMSTRGIKDALRVSKAAKRAGIPVAWGGQFPTLVPEVVLASEYVDYLTMFEGEQTFTELLDAMKNGGDLSHIDNLAFKRDGKVVVNQRRGLTDLSTLPALDFTLIDPEKYFQPFIECKKMLHLYSSKGCIGRCTFCHNNYYHNSSHRRRPLEQIMAEINYLADNYGMDGVYFVDELWCANSAEMRELCAEFKQNRNKFVWGIDARIGQYNYDDLKLMYDAGCRWILFGVESGCAEVQKKIRKCIPMDRVCETFANCAKIGITTQATFLIGFPGETREQVRETVELAKKIEANMLPFNYYFPIPGSPLYEELVASGRYTPPTTLREWSKGEAADGNRLNFSAVPRRELNVVQNTFYWNSFKKKDSISGGKSYGIAKKAVADTLHIIFDGGALAFFANLFLAARRFFYVFWYSHAYPGIKKKYGL